MSMNALDYWQLFLETGAPEMYLMYCKHKSEETHVFDDSGHRPESYGLQWQGRLADYADPPPWQTDREGTGTAAEKQSADW